MNNIQWNKTSVTNYIESWKRIRASNNPTSQYQYFTINKDGVAVTNYKIIYSTTESERKTQSLKEVVARMNSLVTSGLLTTDDEKAIVKDSIETLRDHIQKRTSRKERGITAYFKKKILKRIESNLSTNIKKLEDQRLGNTYVGKYKNGQYQGPGVLTLANGNVLEGRFKNGKLRQGMITYPDGSTYKGAIENNAPKGQGVKILANGNKIVGIFTDAADYVGKMYDEKEKKVYVGRFQGDCLIENKEENYTVFIPHWGTYIGPLKDKKPNGKGTFHHIDGRVFQGTFESRKITFENGDIYEGELMAGVLMHGKGMLVTKNKDLFEGDFEDGEFLKGKGKILFPNNATYKGELKKQLPHGNGKFSSGTTSFEGKFETGQYKGKPIDFGRYKYTLLVYKDGSYYVGQMHFGEPDGRGTLVAKNEKLKRIAKNDNFQGEKLSGRFKNGQLLRLHDL